MSWLKRESGRRVMRLAIALVVTLTSGCCAAWFAREFVRGLWSRRWPEVPATIVSSHVVTMRDSEGESHGARVLYRYTVSGAEYEGRRIRFGGPLSSSIESWAQRIQSRYTARASVHVRVSPEDPRLSVLEPGVAWYLLLALVVCTGLLLLGLRLVLQAVA